MATTIVLYDTAESHADMLPLSYTRPIGEFRLGITTLKEKWERILPGNYTYLTADFLRRKYKSKLGRDNIFVKSTVYPDPAITEAIMNLEVGEALYSDDDWIAFRGTRATRDAKAFRRVACPVKPVILRFVFDIFLNNSRAIADDFEALTAGRRSQPLSLSNTLIGPTNSREGSPNLFIEEGARVEGAILNVEGGPIYIGKGAEVMEGACLRGPIALCDGSKINMGAKVYGGTTIGPVCKVGGELNNAVLFGYSNKAHDGFLGNAVIGEWCNIGAGANASNLKNDYAKIRVWNYPRHTFMRTDLQFCGLIMGDHSKVGINSMFNTASVVGVGVNIHGSGFPRTFIPSFSEGSPSAGFTDVSLDKFFIIADRAMERRGMKLTKEDHAIFQDIFDAASQYK